MPSLRIRNKDARRLWLGAQGLAAAPTGPLDLIRIIHDLGLVQLDTIRIVSRAHHHILWSRNQNYREPMLDQHLRARKIFEHFTHDASVLPMEFYPMWRRQFRRMRQKAEAWHSAKGLPDPSGLEGLLARIAEEGPLSTKDFNSQHAEERKVWSRPPHKIGLDYLWYSGELATSHRENFLKYYDLAERVIPEAILADERSDTVQLDWLCWAALKRLGFATPGEIQRFWDAASNQEVREWVERCPELIPIEVEGADGTWTRAQAPPDIESRLADTPSPTTRLRILNPFDPVIRDRKRLERLFGFEYRIEIFVPAAKRTWGYYVYPILEGDRFVGRIEVRADRSQGLLEVINLWKEPGVKWGAPRERKLEAELVRMGRFVGADQVRWDPKTSIHT